MKKNKITRLKSFDAHCHVIMYTTPALVVASGKVPAYGLSSSFMGRPFTFCTFDAGLAEGKTLKVWKVTDGGGTRAILVGTHDEIEGRQD